MNKYEKWYNQITTRGQTRVTDQRTESHHIIPKCLGGSDDCENLTNVTLREHFICHWLLTKIHQGKHRHQLLKALWMMRAENQNQTRYNTKITSRVYAKLKEEYSVLQSEKVSGSNNPMYGEKFYRSEDGKQRQREAVMGEKNGSKQDTARKKIADSKIGKARAPFSSEWLDNMSKNHKSKQPDFDGSLKEETKKKIGDKIRGRKQTDEEKARRGAANLGKVRLKKLCPHCNQQIAVNTYPRFHGLKCRHRVLTINTVQ